MLGSFFPYACSCCCFARVPVAISAALCGRAMGWEAPSLHCTDEEINCLAGQCMDFITTAHASLAGGGGAAVQAHMPASLQLA